MERLTYQRREQVVLIGLNRPEKRNAFDIKMLEELGRSYTDYEEDPDARCAVLHAHGDHFTGGLELSEVGPAVASGRSLFPEGMVDPFALGLRRLSKPLVVAVQGWCLTLGIELALAADIRIAAVGARFGQIEVKRGIFPFGGATLRMPALTGWGNAMRYLLTGDTFDAAEALRMGLVQEVVPPTDLLDHATKLAARVAAQAPLAIRATLASARSAVNEGLEVEAGRLLGRARSLMGTEDAMEGMRSFIERRDGVFQGR